MRRKLVRDVTVTYGYLLVTKLDFSKVMKNLLPRESSFPNTTTKASKSEFHELLYTPLLLTGLLLHIYSFIRSYKM